MNTQLPEVQIYSDWWANPNPGPWGYGVIMCYKWIKKELYQGYIKTTNNRMELSGVIAWLSQLKTRSKVVIYTDSQYTINGIEKWWAEKWKSNNWFRKGSDKAVNYDLWDILLNLTKKHEVTFHWVKWHNGHIENERCDELATFAMNQDNLILDENFIEKIEIKKPIQESLKSSTTKNTWEITWLLCKKCEGKLVKKIPKHTKKTLEKAYYYAYYHHCEACSTNYMLEEAKRDIKTLVI